VFDPRFKTIAFGVMSAYTVLKETYAEAYSRLPTESLDEEAAEKVWADMFVVLSWLDLFCTRDEVANEMDEELRLALKFVRGKVHHGFVDAIEFRRDVLVFLGPTSSRPGVRGPTPIADWAWVDTAALGGRPGSDQEEYKELLSGRQVAATLDPVATIAADLWSMSS
jgi:hypothetical protein